MIIRNDVIKDFLHAEESEECSYEYNDITLDSLDKSLPVFLFLDDHCGIVKLFKRLTQRSGLVNYFNILAVCGEDAVIKIIDTLYKNQNIVIDVVIADITFGGVVPYCNVNRSFDGVDLVMLLKSLNEDLVYNFITSHNLTPKTMPEMTSKIKSLIGEDDMSKYIILKNESITRNISMLVNLLKDTKYDEISKKINI